MSVTIEDIKDAVWQLKKAKALELVKQAIADGLDPVEVLQKGVIAGLRVVGDKFGAKEYFLAELVMGGKVADPSKRKGAEAPTKGRRGARGASAPGGGASWPAGGASGAHASQGGEGQRPQAGGSGAAPAAAQAGGSSAAAGAE